MLSAVGMVLLEKINVQCTSWQSMRNVPGIVL
jgi:hypothetical protein